MTPLVDATSGVPTPLILPLHPAALGAPHGPEASPVLLLRNSGGALVAASPPVAAPPLPARPRLGRLVLPSVFALGAGAVDAIFYVHFANVVRNMGGGWFVGLGALAAGAAASLLIAPLAAAVSDIKLGGRKPLTLAFNLIALLAAAAVAIVVGTAPGEAGRRHLPGHYTAVATLGGLYRALTLSSPSVPTLIETSLHGDAAGFPARRDASLSFFYVWTRVGLAAGIGSIYSFAGRDLPMWFLLIACIVGVLTLATSAGLIRRPPAIEPPPPGAPPLPGAPPPPPPPSVIGKVLEDQSKALFKTPTGVHKLYVACFFYGVSYGQLAAITAPYYSTVIFKERAGTSRVVQWTGMVAGLNLIIGILIDGLAPKAALAIGARASRWLWPLALLLGGGLFVGLSITSTPAVAFTLFTLQGIPIGAHSFFSLVGAGALVHPSLRATTFGARLAATVTGNLVGAVLAAFLSARWSEGFREVMALCAAVNVAAALAALAVGEFPPLERAKGVATNANVLWSYAFARNRRPGWWEGDGTHGPAAATNAARGAPGGNRHRGCVRGNGGGDGDGDGDGEVEAGNGEGAAKAASLSMQLGSDAEWPMLYWRDDERWYHDAALPVLPALELSPPTTIPAGVADAGGGAGAVSTIRDFSAGWRSHQ